MNYLEYRSQALQGLSLAKDFPPNHWSKDDVEKWVRKEYERHYCPACSMSRASCICQHIE